MQGSWGSRLASLAWKGQQQQQRGGREERAELGRERIGCRRKGAVYHEQVEKYFEKGGAGQIMNCGEFTSASVDGKEELDKGIA